MIFTIVSFSVLTGAPLSGAILSALQGRYIGAQGFAGSSLAAGATFIALAREVKRRKVRARMWDKISEEGKFVHLDLLENQYD